LPKYETTVETPLELAGAYYRSISAHNVTTPLVTPAADFSQTSCGR
jgi:hypothetical protein